MTKRIAGMTANGLCELILLIVLLYTPFYTWFAFMADKSESRVRALYLDLTAVAFLYLTAVFLLPPPA